jgi:hypothetical protein
MKLGVGSRKKTTDRKRDALSFLDSDLKSEKMKVVKRQLSVGLLLAKRPLSQKFQDATTAAETCSPKKLRISVLSSSLSVSEEDDTDATQPPFIEEDDDSLLLKEVCLRQETDCQKEEESPTTTTMGLPLEIMTMIASYLVHPGEAHALSLVSRAWNGACQIAFPRHASPRFIMYAIYENPARLSEVESIADNSMALLALCATVRDEAHLKRLARPDTLPRYVGCVRQAVNDRNYQALCALLTYGLTSVTDPIDATTTDEGFGGWALPAMLDAIHVLARSSDESAPLVFYRAIEGHGQPIAQETVRATCFRRYATGIKIILNIAGIATVHKKDSVYGTDENVRLLLSTAATMNEDLLLSVLNTFPSQTGRILSSPQQQHQQLLGGGPDNFMQTIIRAGWIRAADAIIEAVDDCGHDTHVLLRYSVITGKTWLVRDILFPPRRSSRSKTRERSTTGGTGILTGAKRKRSLSQSPAPGAVTLSDDSLFREAVLLGHEDIATILCLFAPQFVTGQLVIHAVRAGHRAEFIKHLIEYLTEEDRQMCAEQCVRTAIASKNYEVIAMLVSDFVTLTYNKETLMSILASLGPFKIYAPIVSILLHSPRFRTLF